MSARAPGSGPQQPREPKWRAWLKRVKLGPLVAGVAGLILAIGGLLAGIGAIESAQNQSHASAAPSYAALEMKYDHTNPYDTECTSDAHQAPYIDLRTIELTTIPKAVADVFVRHSPNCDTTWVQVENGVDGLSVIKSVRRAKSGQLSAATVTTLDSTDLAGGALAKYSYSDQLFDPTCVYVRVVIEDKSKTKVGELNWTKECH